MAVPPGPVAASTDAELVMFAFVDAYDRAFEAAAAKHELSAAQACVLGRLMRPRRMSELAAELGCDASNITQIIARLETRDLVRRHTSPNDRRSRQIIRTPGGSARYAEFEESFEFARSAISNLSAQEQGQLVTLLRKALSGGEARDG